MKKPILIKKMAATCCAIAAGAMLCASSADAALVLLNGSTTISGASVAGLGDGGGTLVDSVAAQPFAITVGASVIDTGSLATYVYQNDSFNPNAGGLTFIYQLTVTTGDIATLEINGGNLGVPNTYVGYGAASTIPGATTAAFVNGALNLSLYPGGAGTYDFVVASPMTADSSSIASVIDSGISGPILTLVPVPEPTTLIAGGLLMLPCGVSTLRSLRKKQTA